MHAVREQVLLKTSANFTVLPQMACSEQRLSYLEICSRAAHLLHFRRDDFGGGGAGGSSAGCHDLAGVLNEGVHSAKRSDAAFAVPSSLEKSVNCHGSAAENDARQQLCASALGV